MGIAKLDAELCCCIPTCTIWTKTCQKYVWMCWRIALLRPNIYLQTDSHKKAMLCFHYPIKCLLVAVNSLLHSINARTFPRLYCKFIRGKMFRNIHACCVRTSLMSIKTASSPSKDLLNLFHLSVRLAFIRCSLLAEIYFMINIKLILEPRHFNAIHTARIHTKQANETFHRTAQRKAIKNEEWVVSVVWGARRCSLDAHPTQHIMVWFHSVWFTKVRCNVKNNLPKPETMLSICC